MPADVIANPPTASGAADSKGARKKKTKSESMAGKAIATPNPETRADTPSQDAKLNGAEGGSDNLYIRELQK